MEGWMEGLVVAAAREMGRGKALEGSGVDSKGVGSIGAGPRGARAVSFSAARSRLITGAHDDVPRTWRQGALILDWIRGRIS